MLKSLLPELEGFPGYILRLFCDRLFSERHFCGTMHEPKLGVWDFVAVAGYFAAVIGAGIFVSFISNQSNRCQRDRLRVHGKI